MTIHPFFARLRGTLIVSVQAAEDEPLHGAGHMAAMARAVAQGGAAAIRCESPTDVAAIHRVVDLPLIGLYKIKQAQEPVYITPTFESARAIARAGAGAIALDATTERRPDGLTLAETIRRIHDELGCAVMADVSTLDEGLRAVAAGADVVGTTLSGYTPQSLGRGEGPDWELLEGLVRAAGVPVILEGRVWEPQEVSRGLGLGAWAVVVGSAITRPQLITARFAAAVSRAREEIGPHA
jgi:N-acylglucosamine-6-phosphate 2-epimerase